MFHFFKHKRHKQMIKAFPNTDKLVFDTLATEGPAQFVTFTTTGGLTVTVPAGSIPGEYVQLNTDGTAPTTPLTPIDATTFSADFTVTQ